MIKEGLHKAITEHKIEGLELLEPSCEDDPVFEYRSPWFGHLNYLKKECENHGIRSRVYDGSLQLYSKRKLGDFVRIVEDSLAYLEAPEPTVSRFITSYKNGQSLIGVLVIGDKNRATFHTTENCMEELVYFIYTKQTPRPYHFIIHDTRKKMEAFFEKEHNYYL